VPGTVNLFHLLNCVCTQRKHNGLILTNSAFIGIISQRSSAMHFFPPLILSLPSAPHPLTHTHTHTHTYTHTHTNTHTKTYTHRSCKATTCTPPQASPQTHSSIPPHTHTYTYTHTYAHTRTRTHTNMHTQVLQGYNLHASSGQPTDAQQQGQGRGARGKKAKNKRKQQRQRCVQVLRKKRSRSRSGSVIVCCGGQQGCVNGFDHHWFEILSCVG